MPAGRTTNSLARFGALLTGEAPGQWRFTGVGSVGFLTAPAAGRPPPFRTLELRVDGTGVGGSWDHQPVGWLSPALAAGSLITARYIACRASGVPGNRDLELPRPCSSGASKGK